MKTLFNAEQARKVLAFLKEKKLSEKEIEVAVLVAHGLSNNEIASELSVTEKTIKFHLTNIFKKMGEKGRSRLIVAVFTQVLGNTTEEEQVVESTNNLDVSNTIPAGSQTVGVSNETNL